jgi:hypothetical protein
MKVPLWYPTGIRRCRDWYSNTDDARSVKQMCTFQVFETKLLPIYHKSREYRRTRALSEAQIVRSEVYDVYNVHCACVRLATALHAPWECCN